MLSKMIISWILMICLFGSLELSANNAEQVKFYITSRTDPKFNEFTMGTNVNLGKPMAVVIHGYTGNAVYKPCTLIKEAILLKYDWNIVFVDWNDACEDCLFKETSRNVERIGQSVGRFFNMIISQLHFNPKYITVIGIDLGAQIAGVAAHKVRTLKIGKIIALDPVVDRFARKPRKDRLDASDAKFVMSVQTVDVKADVRARNRLGHANFFPNGGRAIQPGCMDDDWNSVCSHFMAVIYFVESLYNSTAFLGGRCRTWNDYIHNRCCCKKAYLDMNSISAQGSYFFRTTSQTTYGHDLQGRKVWPATIRYMVVEFFFELLARQPQWMQEETALEKPPY